MSRRDDGARRSSWQLHATPAVLLAFSLVGCSSVTGSQLGGSPTPASSTSSQPIPTMTASPAGTSKTAACVGTPGATVGPATASSGPASDLVTVAVTPPMSAAPGASITVVTQLAVRADGPRIVLRPETSGLQVLRGHTVVTRAVGEPGSAVPLQLRAGQQRPAQTVPARIALVGCDGTPLPPGSYGLQAVVGYGSDPMNGAAGAQAGDFTLVSVPVPLIIS